MMLLNAKLFDLFLVVVHSDAIVLYEGECTGHDTSQKISHKRTKKTSPPVIVPELEFPELEYSPQQQKSSYKRGKRRSPPGELPAGMEPVLETGYPRPELPAPAPEMNSFMKSKKRLPILPELEYPQQQPEKTSYKKMQKILQYLFA